MLIMIALTFAPASIRAQVLLAPEPQSANQNVQCQTFDNPSAPLTRLRDHYLSGRWERLLAETRALLDNCAFVPEEADRALFTESSGANTTTHRPNYARDWYLIVLATVDRDDQPLIIRYLLHDPLPYAYTTATVGVPSEPRDIRGTKVNDASTPRLVQAFLAPKKALSLETRIQVTETADPLQEQIADVAKAVFDPSVIVPLLKGLIPPSSRAAAPSSTRGPIFASISRIFPPYERAEYKYTDVIRAPAMLDADKALLLRDKFDGQVEAALKAAEGAEKAAADATKAELEIRNSTTATAQEKARAVARRDSAVATASSRVQELDLARALSASASNYLLEQRDKDCSPALYRETCWSGLGLSLKTAKETFCLERTTFCMENRADLVLLRFGEVGQPPKTTTSSTSTTVTGIPFQRLTFGTLGAYVAGASAPKDRVKVDGGKVVADPIGRAMTSVVLNFHPRFNPKAPRMETGERWRGFIGAVLTPNLGISVGAGYGFLRNLSINAGYALLVIPTLRDGDTIDAAASDGTRPFRAGAAHVGFVGLGYKFGK